MYYYVLLHKQSSTWCRKNRVLFTVFNRASTEVVRRHRNYCQCHPRPFILSHGPILDTQKIISFEFYFRPCVRCECSGLVGSKGSCYNNADAEKLTRQGVQPGDCICKPGFAGSRCDHCDKGFHNYPYCEPCPCTLGASINYVAIRRLLRRRHKFSGFLQFFNYIIDFNIWKANNDFSIVIQEFLSLNENTKNGVF